MVCDWRRAMGVWEGLWLMPIEVLKNLKTMVNIMIGVKVGFGIVGVA